TKGIDGTLNLHVPSALHLMKGTTKNGPWTEIEYASSLPDRFVRLTPYYHVTFNGNGGTGYMSSQSNVEYQTFNLAENAFKKDIFEFNGWNTEADGSGMPYGDRESVTLTGDLTLYAQWIQGKLDTKYKQKIDVKSLLLPIYTSNNPDAVIKKIKFKTSNRKVVKVTKKGIATGGKRSGKATITMYVKTQIIVTNSKGKKKKKTSKWTVAGRLTVENTGKPSKK
nr:InlB B-repeat-containing protein [Lachnospiraceae bacterium]